MPHEALCIISLPCVSSNWSYDSETAKLGFDLCDLDLWPLTLTFCMDITFFVISNNSWKFHDDTLTGTLWQRCDRHTRQVFAACSQLKNQTHFLPSISGNKWFHATFEDHKSFKMADNLLSYLSALKELIPLAVSIPVLLAPVQTLLVSIAVQASFTLWC